MEAFEGLSDALPPPRVLPPEGVSAPKFVEAWGGDCVLSAEMVAHGFLAQAYEKYPSGLSAEGREGGDMKNAEVQGNLDESLRNGEIFELHLAPDCSSWGSLQNLNHTTRTVDQPEGTGVKPNEVDGNEQAAIAIYFFLRCLEEGIWVSFEHPRASRVWMLPIMVFLRALDGMFDMDLDMCAHGLRPPGWGPNLGDIRTQKSSRVRTSNPHLEGVRKHCLDAGPHKHERALGHSADGTSRAHAAGRYARAVLDGRMEAVPSLPKVTNGGAPLKNRRWLVIRCNQKM